MPFFSIVIPTYNSSDSIEQALQSITSQDFTDFEVLLMDGGSTDSTLAIAKGLKDVRIRIFSEADKGPYDAMNKGIIQASGEWLYFLGSDDYLNDKSVLEKVKDFIIDGNKKIVYGNVFVKGNTGWANDGKVYDGVFTLKKLTQQNICHQAIFYKRSIFNKVGCYNLKYTICADYDLNLRVAAEFRLNYFDCIIAVFNAGGYSTKILQDSLFEKDKRENIITYFSRFIHKSDFVFFQPYIITVSKSLLIKGKLFKALQLMYRKGLIKLGFTSIF